MGREILPGQGREPFPLHPDGGLEAGCYKCLLWGVQVGLSFQSLAQNCRTGAARSREGPVLGGKQSLMLSLEHWGRREESTSFQREGPEFRRKSQDSEGQPLKPELMRQFLLDAGGESFPTQHSVSSQIITGFSQVSLLLTFLRELKVSTTEEIKSHRETSSSRGERRGGIPSRTSQPGLEKMLCKRQTQVVPGLHPGPATRPTREPCFPVVTHDLARWHLQKGAPWEAEARPQLGNSVQPPVSGEPGPCSDDLTKVLVPLDTDNKGDRDAGVSWECLC